MKKKSTKSEELTIDQIKQEMLNHKDFWGGNIIYTDEILQATTKKDLATVMDNYGVHLEMMALDAQSRHDNLRTKLGLNSQ